MSNLANNSRGGKDSQHDNDKPSRPIALPVHADGIPDQLKALDRWVVWRYDWVPPKEGKPGKWNKAPRCARTRKNASSTNPATWSSFEEALAAYQRGGLDGIGFVLAAEEGREPVLVGIDIDHCRDRDSGTIEPWAQSILDKIRTYTEASPSGTGVRALLYGRIPGDIDNDNKTPLETGAYENYESGRYVTITGCRLEGSPATIESRQAELVEVHRQVFAERYRQVSWTPPRQYQPPVDMDDAEVLALALKNPEFRAHWEGSTRGYPSQSEAELAFCNKLAFWCRKDPARMDAWFRQSGLYRKKWERADYRNGTIRKAIASCTNVFEPRRRHECNDKASGHGAPAPKSECPIPPVSTSFALGPLTVQTGPPRRTPTKITVPLLILRDGRMIDQLGLSTSMTGRRLVAQQLGMYLGADKARERIDAVLGQILAEAAQTPTASVEGQTLHAIVAEKVPEAMRFACRTKTGLWSEAVGDDVRRGDLVAYTPSWLVEAAGNAVDAPRDEQGVVNRPALFRALQGELGVLWADLLTSLPRESEVNLGSDTERGRQFRQAVIQLWKTPVTWETHETDHGETATRASLVSRVWSQSKHGKVAPDPRERWRRIHPACDAWWRPWLDGEGELHILLGMRWTLMCQAKVLLPGVTNEDSLTRLGERFRVLRDPPPPVSSRLSGGGRLGVLAPDLCRELLEEPTDDPEDNPREPGAEG